MLPTSTRIRINIEKNVPAKTDGLALVLGEKQPAQHPWAQRLIDKGVFRGKAREIVAELGDESGQVLLAGIGPVEKATPEAIREAAGGLLRMARRRKIARLAIHLPIIKGVGAEDAVEALVSGLCLAAFAFRETKGAASKSSDDQSDSPLSASIVVDDPRGLKAAFDSALAIAESQNYARTIATRPGNQINPPALADVARAAAKEVGLACKVLDEKELQRLGMGGILAVGSGSPHPPRMIILEHRPPRAKKGEKPLLIVGKAITFDTGGISIKPADKMGKMIFDKCGAMAVLGTMVAVARLKLPIHVVGILSSAENHVSGTAYRPGDVLKMYNGVTVEVTNTDAEGRLVLGDALAYGIETYKPAAVTELSTLTGGCVVALGRTMAGVMCNNDRLFAEIQAAANASGEKIWRLPLGDEQREMLKSDFADIVNSAGREGSPLQGGAFLSYFVPRDDSVAFAHIDIAGVSDTDKELPYYAKGATGWGVRTLVEWIEQRASDLAR